MSDALPRAFFDRPVLDVAPDLLGRVLICSSPRGTVAVRLTEVEAYDGEQDPGSHAFRGRTARNAVMFGPPGHAYVYFTYGMHWCVNLVCGPAGRAGAVLLRAGGIELGVELARERRPTTRSDRDLARGPARLTLALGIDGRYDGADVTGEVRGAAPRSRPEPESAADREVEPGLLRLLPGLPVEPAAVRSGPRVGVGGAGGQTPWRFWATGEPTVSAYRPHIPRRRAGAGVPRGAQR